MKPLIYYSGVTLLLLSLLSCEHGEGTEPENTELRHVRVGLSAMVETRARDVTDQQESAVTESTLYVFSRDGRMVGCYTSRSGLFDFYLTDETYDFVAVANKQEMPSSLTRDELSALPTRLDENAPGRFIMVGSLPNHVVQEDEKLTVGVQRIVSKVSYKIRTKFTGTLATKSFTVDEIYLTNVAGENVLGLTGAPAGSDRWHNRLDRTASAGAALDDLLYGRLGVAMAPVDSIWSGHTFYVYLNASPDSHDKSAWSPRCTRFVVKATLDGRTTYYPVTIPSTVSNKHYHIDLTISNYGVDHPEDIAQESAYLDAVVSVSTWEDGGTIYGEY
jgi:hypothetical protein